MEFNHKTVLLKETIEALDISPAGVYVDCTAGGGGLSFQIAMRLSKSGHLVCIDQDPDAITVCSERLEKFDNVSVVKSNFSQVLDVVHNLGFEHVHAVVLDLGVSSHQLDLAERGFSYNKDAPLDMRMSQSGESAYDVVNSLSFKELKKIITKYGEERFASRIARAITEKREKTPIKTTFELAEIVKTAIPAATRREGGNPARKTFQAIRIYVNNELENLEIALQKSFEILKPGGKMVVLTFHSLEDRIVKSAMREWARGCVCPSDFPICVCGKKPLARILHKKAVKPSKKEIEANPRSRSAKLRICEKL